MKLLLTSAGIANPSLVSALLKLVGKPFKQAGLVFIPTASNVEEGDKGWLIDDLVNLKQLDFASVDIVDISALPKEIWLPRIKEADVLVFSGGNTFHLMSWLRKSGLDIMLPELLKNKVYVGISAGSMVVSKSIFLTSDKPIFDENRLGVTDDTGLGLVDFYIRPHFNSPYFPKAKEEAIVEAAKKVSEPIFALDDNSAVLVNENKAEIVSEGEWKKFN
ncbi:MAG: peptidase E [Candidatus Shapirobacteria bacterium]|jgi:dipeptidase E